MQTPRHNFCGGALISALFITAICAMMAVALAMRERLLIHEGELIMRADQAYANLQRVQYWAVAKIAQYKAQANSPSQKPLQTQFPAIQVDGMEIAGDIEDAQAKFNLNNLIATASQPSFAVLLQSRAAVSQKAAIAIAQAVTAWITTGDQDSYYLNLKPPYRSSRSEMADKSELRLVMGVTPEIYAAISNDIIALPLKQDTNPSSTQSTPDASGIPNVTPPSQTLISVNGKPSGYVLLTANPGMSLDKANQVADCGATHQNFANVQDFLNTCAKPYNVSLSNITANSAYYLVKAYAKNNDNLMQLTSLLVTRRDKNNKLTVVVEWQSFH